MCHLISSPTIFFSQSMKKTSTKMYYFPYFQGRVPAWNLAGLLPPDPTSPGPGGPSPGAVSAPGGLAHPLPHYSGAYGSQPATPVHYSHLLPQGNLLKGIKGQLISKYVFGVFKFFHKTNENMSTWGIIVVKSNFFLFVFGRIEDTKKSFWN